LPEGAGTFVCQTCQGRDFFFDYAVSPYQSRGVLRELIHRFKYQRQLFLGPLLGSLLVDVLQDERIVDLRQDWVAVPVPLHARRYREREFNQALELCRELQERSGIPYVNALKRTRYTSSQTRYRREQRMENLRGAFVPRRWKVGHVAGRTVALVDDVFTTGSTANECARVLLASGAKKVVVITLARG
jgi:ComF family protein